MSDRDVALFDGIEPGSRVWHPTADGGYGLATVESVEGEGAAAVYSVCVEGGEVCELAAGEVYPLNPASQDGAEDNTQLMYLHEPHLVHNLRCRYANDDIYTYTAYILLAINPYKTLDVYSPEIMETYRGKSIGLMPPSVFAVADRAYRSMKASTMSQSILVSGESGAGKTETCKFVMRYLAAVGGDLNLGGVIETRIVEANPLLESFGNAKTTRNHNSSRFGKFTEIHFDGNARVVGAAISTYLLEKSRIVHQNASERNYHIFYQLCGGAPEDVRSELKLGAASAYYYLNRSECKPIAAFPEDTSYARTVASMTCVGMSPDEQMDVFKVVAGVLHLGNIGITPVKRGDGSAIAADDPALLDAAAFLGTSPAALSERIVGRMMKVRGKAESFRIPLSEDEARHARDALAKAVYSAMFDWIVERINLSLPFDSSAAYIGVLDIAGFEFFEHNSFEQFCINYANEKLQQHFNEQILDQEQQLYEKEGIRYKEIAFRDNQDVIDLIELPKGGIVSILDEQCRLPQASDVRFTQAVHSAHDAHARMLDVRKFKTPGGKRHQADEAFVIRHFAGDVCYSTDGFLDKNHDALNPDLFGLVASSSVPFISASLFPADDPVDDDGASASAQNTPAPSSKPKPKGSRSLTVGGKFRKQMLVLMDRLHETSSNFIRCVKPNEDQVPAKFDTVSIIHQLRCAGMLEALLLMQTGYPTRCKFTELCALYKHLMPPALAKLEPAVFCEALLFALELDRRDFQLGLTQVFFRAGKMAFLDRIMSSDEGIAEEIVAKVEVWLHKKRVLRLQYATLALTRLAAGIARSRARAKFAALATATHTLSTSLLSNLAGLREFVAARTIQALFRGYATRKTFLRSRSAAIVLQTAVRAFVTYRKHYPARAALKAARRAAARSSAAAAKAAARTEAAAARAAARARARADAKLQREARSQALASQMRAEQERREREESRFKEQFDALEAEAAAKLQAIEEAAAAAAAAAAAEADALAAAAAATKSELDAAREEAEAERVRAEQTDAALRSAKADAGGLAARVAELEAEVAAAQSDIGRLEAKVRAADAAKSAAEAEVVRLAPFEGEAARASARVAELTDELDDALGKVRKAKKARSAADAARAELEADLVAAQDAAATMSKDQLAALKSELSEARVQIEELEDAAVAAEAGARASAAAAADENMRLAGEVRALEAAARAAAEEHEAAARKSSKLERKLRTLRDEVDAIRVEAEAAEERAAANERRLKATIADLELNGGASEEELADLTAMFEGKISALTAKLMNEESLRLSAETKLARVQAELDAVEDEGAQRHRKTLRLERQVKRLTSQVAELEDDLATERSARRKAGRSGRASRASRLATEPSAARLSTSLDTGLAEFALDTSAAPADDLTTAPASDPAPAVVVDAAADDSVLVPGASFDTSAFALDISGITLDVSLDMPDVSLDTGGA